jgi:hypothetical protein
MEQHLLKQVEQFRIFLFLWAIGISQNIRAGAGADDERGISSVHVLASTNNPN